MDLSLWGNWWKSGRQLGAREMPVWELKVDEEWILSSSLRSFRLSADGLFLLLCTFWKKSIVSTLLACFLIISLRTRELAGQTCIKPLSAIPSFLSTWVSDFSLLLSFWELKIACLSNLILKSYSLVHVHYCLSNFLFFFELHVASILFHLDISLRAVHSIWEFRTAQGTTRPTRHV